MSFDMNPEVRAQWCAALRSGNYRQGKGYLRHGDSYCCLGVLCDLAVKAEVITAPADLGGTWSFDGYPDYLPPAVTRWAGLQDASPAALVNGQPVILATANDDDISFAEIADLIDGGAS